MANLGIRDITVSFLDNSISNISLVQGDTLSRGFDITFIDAKGDIIPPDDDYMVELIATNRSDRHTPYANKHEVVGGKYRVMIPPEALKDSGAVTLQLAFYQKSTGAVIHTIAQKCAIHKGLGQEFIDSNNLYVDIAELRLGIEKLETLAVKYEETIELGNSLISKEETRESSETVRVENELVRNANETDRVENELARNSNEEDRIIKELTRTEKELDREANENSRKSNEDSRVSKETSRVEKELERELKEKSRISNDELRELRETDRVSNEEFRVSEETDRVSREEDRVAKELIRESNEEERLINEITRLEQEDSRKLNESLRKEQEELRGSNEGSRKSNEDNRKSNENIRQEQENLRESKEITRKSNEDTRVSQEISRETAESARVANEDERKKFFKEWSTSEGTTPKIENATEDVAGIVKVSKTDDETEPHTVMTVGKVTETIKSEIDKIPPAEGSGDMPVADEDVIGGVMVEKAFSSEKAPYKVPSMRWLNSDSVQIGSKADSRSFSVAIGHEARVEHNNSTAIGAYSRTMIGKFSTAIGAYATTLRNYSTAIGVYSSAGNANYATAIGTRAIASEANQGVLGTDSDDSRGTHTWLVPGNFSVGGTKNFEIPHPNPEKTETHLLRHGAVETNSQGDNLYRYKIEAKEDGETVVINLPDYFVHLNKNVQIWATGINHFGNAFGNYKPEEETIGIVCEKAGEYNILVIGTRNDNHISVQSWSDKGVEKLKGTSWTFAEDLRRAEAKEKEEEGLDDFEEEYRNLYSDED